VYARRDGEPIGLAHLVEAATAECRELGMLISDKLPKRLTQALKEERTQHNRTAKPSTTIVRSPAPPEPAAPTG
jgi:hypothetical protein